VPPGRNRKRGFALPSGPEDDLEGEEGDDGED